MPNLPRETLPLAVSFHRRERDGVVWYESPLLAMRNVRHGFYTRIGGVSGGPFNSLNAGLSTDDDPANVEENRRRVMDRRPGPLVMVRQVHGSRIAGAGDVGCEADAVALSIGEGTAGVLTADCCPILLMHPGTWGNDAVAAVHAGWRGMAGGVIEAAVARLVKLTGRPAMHIVAAIGPCIGPDAFEVGEEVADAFGNDPATVLRRDGWPKPHIDLPAAAAVRLEHAGVRRQTIDLARLCTVERPAEFFSHRRDAGRTGRMLNVIAPLEREPDLRP